MGKKNLFLLRSIVLLLVVVVLIGFTYAFSRHYISEYYSSGEKDITVSSMKQENFVSFKDGSSVLTGSFLQNNDPFSEKALYLKGFDNAGIATVTSGVQIPAGYLNTDTITLSDRVYLRYDAESGNSNVIKLYEISSKGELLSEKNITSPSKNTLSRDIFVFTDGSDIFYGVKTVNELGIFDMENELLCTLLLLPDVELTNVSVFNDTYVVLGKIKNQNTANAYYGAYSKDGTQLYSNSTMIDYTSVCSEYIPSPTNKDSYFVFGFFFDSPKYMESYYKDAETLSEEQLLDIAKKSIERTSKNNSVLLKSDYLKEPWASMFVLEVNSNGEIKNSCTPEITSASGISSVNILGTGYGNIDTARSNKKVPIVTLTSAMAEDKYAPSYNVVIYNIYSDLTMSDSAQIKLNSDVETLYTATYDDRLLVYSLINGKNQSSVHCYDDTVSYATEQRALVLCNAVTSYIDSSLSKLPMLCVYLILLITVRYAYLDYTEKARKYNGE